MANDFHPKVWPKAVKPKAKKSKGFPAVQATKVTKVGKVVKRKK